VSVDELQTSVGCDEVGLKYYGENVNGVCSPERVVLWREEDSVNVNVN
jgi:hypothetical protein